ncbi:MAG: hypothetical protein IT514_09210, partial [Burkholderiales bacterium]|nr:hypothetical protein [Burkholderiales bacterium]
MSGSDAKAGAAPAAGGVRRAGAKEGEHRTGAEGDVRRAGSAMRLRGLVRKEFLQVVRDPSSIAIAFLMPVLLLLLFGYGLSLDVRQVPLALVIEEPGPET